MKKGLFLSLAATALLAGCSGDEVIEQAAVAKPQAITFENPFVDKATKAGDITTADLNKFWVYGAYTNKGNIENPKDVFTNILVEGTQDSDYTPTEAKYWVKDKDYRFTAYSNGGNQITENIDFTNTTGNLKLTKYVAGSNDLILAHSTPNPITGLENGNGKVGLTFSHLLAKVKFTLTNKCGVQLTLKNLKFNALGTATYDNEKWGALETPKDFIFTSSQNIANLSTNADECVYVIPQANNTLKASFIIEATIDGIDYSKKFTNVNLTATENKWNAGYVYNYTATITPETFGAEQIIFNVTAVEGWEDTTPKDTPVTPV